MPGWINEIAALAACGLGILLLIVVVRALIFLLKISAIGMLIAFIVHAFGPELALNAQQRQDVYAYASVAAEKAAGFGFAAWREIKDIRTRLPEERRGRSS